MTLSTSPVLAQPPQRKKVRRVYLAAAALVVLVAGAIAGILLSTGGPGLAASPAQISKDLVGQVNGSPLAIFVVKTVTVHGTPVDNGKTETARITITWGFIPGASGTPPGPTEALFTLNDKTKAWSWNQTGTHSMPRDIYIKAGTKIQEGGTQVVIGSGGLSIP